MEKNSRNAKTGLLYHPWDESKEQKWANKTTGLSPHFWARAMGWYATALVDVLDYFPENNPKRKDLIAILNRLTIAIEKQQQKPSGLWFDVMNIPTNSKNYLEASASCQFVYAIAKGVRKGYIPAAKIAIAKKGYEGIKKEFIKQENGQTVLTGTVKVSGLGGNPYRDGSLDYYFSEPVITNDPKGLGVFLMASNEMEILKTQSVGKGKTVLLDSYFNDEQKKDVTGIEKSWHYKWNEKSNGGFSLLGNVFNTYGANTKTLYEAPTATNLSKADVYIIVDADNVADNPKPNYMSEKDAQVIHDWVKKGGVLLLFHNDKGNCDFEHLNILSQKLGFYFNENCRNKVEGKKFEMGEVEVYCYNKEYIIQGKTFNRNENGQCIGSYHQINLNFLYFNSIKNKSNTSKNKDTLNLIFETATKLFLKEISTLKIFSSNQPKAFYTERNDTLMFERKVDNGYVFAVGDPWLYNEYVDGRKLPAEFENFKAANDLVKWALSQSKKAKTKNKK